MKKCLVAIIAICFAISPAYALEENQAKGKIPVQIIYYKTKEEVAWNILMYGLKNIPSMKFRINHYEDLLEAYRMTLKVVMDPKEPIPKFPEVK